MHHKKNTKLVYWHYCRKKKGSREMRDGGVVEEIVKERGRGRHSHFVNLSISCWPGLTGARLILPTRCSDSCSNTTQLQCQLSLFPSHPPCRPPTLQHPHPDSLTSFLFQTHKQQPDEITELFLFSLL